MQHVDNFSQMIQHAVAIHHEQRVQREHDYEEACDRALLAQGILISQKSPVPLPARYVTIDGPRVTIGKGLDIAAAITIDCTDPSNASDRIGFFIETLSVIKTSVDAARKDGTPPHNLPSLSQTIQAAVAAYDKRYNPQPTNL